MSITFVRVSLATYSTKDTFSPISRIWERVCTVAWSASKWDVWNFVVFGICCVLYAVGVDVTCVDVLYRLVKTWEGALLQAPIAYRCWLLMLISKRASMATKGQDNATPETETNRKIDEQAYRYRDVYQKKKKKKANYLVTQFLLLPSIAQHSKSCNV